MAPTYISLNAPIVWPGNTNVLQGATPASAAFDLLDSNGGVAGAADATAFVICAPKDLAISHGFFKCAAVTGGTTTANLRIETVDPATGYPTGTLWATNTNGVSGNLTTGMNTVALTATANITKGQMFAIVITWNSVGSFSVANVAMGSSNYYSVPYKLTNITGAWAKVGLLGSAVAIGSSATDPYYIPGFLPISASPGANAFNNTSSARRGARFRVPVDCYISGLRYPTYTAVGDFSAIILDASNNELGSSSTAFEGDITSGLNAGCQNLFFDNEVGPLAVATDYFLAIVPASATNCNMYTLTLSSNNFRKAFPGGTDFDYATGTPTMAAIDTQVPLLDLLISRVPLGGGDPVGGSGAHVIGI